MKKRMSVAESLSLLKQGSSPKRSPKKTKKKSDEKPAEDVFDLLKTPPKKKKDKKTEEEREEEREEEEIEEEEIEEEREEEEQEEEEQEEEREEERPESPISVMESSEDERPESPTSEMESSEDERPESPTSEMESSEDERSESPRKTVSDSESSEEDYDDEDEVDEVEIKNSKKILPITPKKFTVSSPRTPKKRLKKGSKNDRGNSFLNKLSEYRYSIVRFLYLDDKLKFVMCYDPRGQIVFILVPEHVEEEIEKNKKRENIDKIDVVKIVTVPEKLDNPLDEAFVNSVKQKVDLGAYGLIFYNGVDYQICERNSRGFFKDRYCVVKGNPKEDKLSLPQTYIISNLKDMIENHEQLLLDNSSNYEKIQKQQLEKSNLNFKDIVKSLKTLEEYMVTFKEVYQSHLKGILSDWEILGKEADEFYKKYSEQELSKEEQEEYTLVTLNRFLRFQFNIESAELMDRIHNVKNHLEQATDIIVDAISEIEEKDANVKHNLLKRDEIDEYL